MSEDRQYIDADCRICGEPAVEYGPNTMPVCAEHAPETDDAPAAEAEATPEEDTAGGCECPNPVCIHNTDDEERAALFWEFVEALDAHFDCKDDLKFMPIEGDDKLPALNKYGAPLESREADLLLYDADEAYTALYNGHPGFALYAGRWDHGTDDVLFVDNDDPETFPEDELPDTLKVMSGSGGGYHYTYEHGLSFDNSKASGDTDGEVRGSNWYVKVPGSLHGSGGIYHVVEQREIVEVTDDELPEVLEPSTASGEVSNEAVEMSTPEELQDAEFTNDVGMSLEEVREKSEKLDDLLTYLNPPGHGHDDTSRFDYATAGMLYWWRFDENQVADIIRKYRPREKVTQRDDYLDMTVRKACTGDRMDPNADEEEPVSTLPLGLLDNMDTTARRRFAKRRGVDWPDVDSLRNRLQDTIKQAIRNNENTVIRSPTGSGKTHAVATEEWLFEPEVTENQPVVHAHKSREARDQAASMSEEAHGNYAVLRGRKETCPVAAGEYDPGNEEGNREITVDDKPVSRFIDHLCDTLNYPYSVVHGWVEEMTEHTLPCEEGDTECHSKSIFDGIPRTDDGDPAANVIHTTHQFLHVPGLRLHTNIVYDEKPDFGMDVPPETIRRSVNAYLDYIDLPINNYSELAMAAQNDMVPSGQKTLDTASDDATGDEIMKSIEDDSLVAEYARRASLEALWGALDRQTLVNYVDGSENDADDYSPDEIQDLVDEAGDYYLSQSVDIERLISESLSRDPPLSWHKSHHDVHAYAAAFARALWNAEEQAGGFRSGTVLFEPPRYDSDAHDSDAWNREVMTVVFDSDWEIVRTRCKPDYMLANAVIGLDAHAQPRDPMWRMNLSDSVDLTRVLTEEEETLYRRYERGLYTVQVGDATNPVTSGQYLDGGQGKKFKATINHLSQQYGPDFDAAITSQSAEPWLTDAMKDAGVAEPETMHYGEEESRNDFAGKDVGYVMGSIDPGDEPVMHSLAELGLRAEPSTTECPTCEGDGCERCDHEGRHREHGRTFDGQDSEDAERFIKGVREHHIAQSAGRWARNPEKKDDGAVVFIHTDATPSGFVDVKAPGPYWTASDEQKDVITALRDAGSGATAREIAEGVDVSKRSVNRTLKKAHNLGMVEAAPGAGAYGATVYEPREWINEEGAVDLPEVETETATEDVLDSYTWSVSITSEERDTMRGISADTEESLTQTSLAVAEPGGGPPE